jgi:hypothetical protein
LRCFASLHGFENNVHRRFSISHQHSEIVMKLAASLLVLLLAAPVAASILHAQCNDPAVLITGGVTSFDPGNATQTAELYDPKTDTFIQVGEMIDARVEHTATRLLDGSVLVVGGFALAGGSALASAELFDSATKTFRLAANMHEDRAGHAATRLPSGNVLISGGSSLPGTNPALSSAEIYNWRRGFFRRTGSMIVPRVGHNATLLTTGKVLVVDGDPTGGTAGELFDPATQSFTRTAGDMSAAHDTATGLVSGKVLVAGDTGLAGQPADLYDPVSDSFRLTHGLFPFAASATTATRLLNGRVLFTGGFAFRYESNGAFLYFPYGQGFGQRYSSLPSHEMSVPRVDHTATRLPNGKVLIAGGWACALGLICLDTGYQIFATAELYDPATQTFTPTNGLMTTPRYGHTATLICR